MQHLLHAPRSSIVFATVNSSISRFLRRQHKWAGVQSECSTLPDYISVSCIRELDNGEVEIDDEVLNGNQLAGGIQSLLVRDEFKEPDFRFVGRLVRPVNVKSGHDHGGSSKERIDDWDEDGLGKGGE